MSTHELLSRHSTASVQTKGASPVQLMLPLAAGVEAHDAPAGNDAHSRSLQVTRASRSKVDAQESSSWFLLELATGLVAAYAVYWFLDGAIAGAPPEHVYAFISQMCLSAPLAIYSDVRRRRAKRPTS